MKRKSGRPRRGMIATVYSDGTVRLSVAVWDMLERVAIPRWEGNPYVEWSIYHDVLVLRPAVSSIRGKTYKIQKYPNGVICFKSKTLLNSVGGRKTILPTAVDRPE